MSSGIAPSSGAEPTISTSSPRSTKPLWRGRRQPQLRPGIEQEPDGPAGARRRLRTAAARRRSRRDRRASSSAARSPARPRSASSTADRLRRSERCDDLLAAPQHLANASCTPGASAAPSARTRAPQPARLALSETVPREWSSRAAAAPRRPVSASQVSRVISIWSPVSRVAASTRAAVLTASRSR